MSQIEDHARQIPWVGAPRDEGAGSAEMDQPGGGRVRDYDNASIYWSPRTGAHEVHGDIRIHYGRHRGPGGFLGYPQTDETPCPDGVGRFNHFEGGSIYWTPETGAREVHGDIRATWGSLGWERGRLGYPISDEFDTPGVPGGRSSRFQRGVIEWTAQRGATVHESVRID